MIRASDTRGSWIFSLCIAGLLCVALFLAGRSLDLPGLYYDEAVQARPALEFATGHVHASEFPGSRGVWLGNRKFPLMTQPYMGALKSQALIPSLWIGGASVEVLRLTTLLWALCGLAFVAAFSRRAFGGATALVATVFLVSDPSFLLTARHDWGSFSLSFLLRGITLWCALRFWQSRQAAWLLIAGFATGLACYNKVDIVIFAVAVAGATLAVAHGPLITAWREQPHRARVALGALLAFALGLGPMIPALGAVLGARNAFAAPDELAEKLSTLFAMSDGSYFHRLMSTGGMFGADSLGQVADAPGSLFPVALLFAMVWLLFRALQRPSGEATDGRDRRGPFLLLASVLSLLGVLALPGAVRIHHAMNSYPLLHLLLAYALVDAARVAGGVAERAPGESDGPTARARIAGAVAVAIGLAIVATQWSTLEHTRRALEASGGTGRWSNAIHQYAAELDGSFEGVVSSLDWGFHEPLAFLAAGGTFREVHWQIPRAVRERGSWVATGEPGDHYLVHLAPYDRSGFGEPFLAAAETLGSEHVAIRRHRDRQGEVAFVSVRIDAAHRITFAGTATGQGAFRIEVGR